MKLVPALFRSANVLEIAGPAREWLKRQQAKLFCGNLYVAELRPSCWGGANFNGWEGLALPSPLVLAPARSIVTIFIIFIYVASTLPWNPVHLASRGWSCRDAGQHGTNRGHPGRVTTLLPISWTSSTAIWFHVPAISMATGKKRWVPARSQYLEDLLAAALSAAAPGQHAVSCRWDLA